MPQLDIGKKIRQLREKKAWTRISSRWLEA
jgi:hypothetical protein